PRLHPAPRQPGGGARPSAPLAPQSTLRRRPDSRGAGGNRARCVRVVQKRHPGEADMGGFLILLVLLAAAWLLFVIPARRRRQSHGSMQDSVDVGDEIITAGGLHGVVREVGDDTLRIEIAADVVAVLDRRAVAEVAREVEVEVEPEDEVEVDPENAAETPPQPG